VIPLRFRHIIAGLLSLGIFLDGSAAVRAAGPGSGSATVSPETAVVATPGTWTITYEAEEEMSGGTIRITIPSGWTQPQDGEQTAAGYVTVTSSAGTANPSLSIADSVVTISVETLPDGQTVTLVYGDDGGGVNPGARAIPDSVAQPDVEFLVESDPNGTSPAPLTAGSPTVSLDPGAITKLAFTNDPFEFESTSEAGPFWVETQDSYSNPSPVGSDQKVNLFSTSLDGSFSAIAEDTVEVGSVTMPTGSSSVSFYYRDTKVGTPTVKAEAEGQAWADSQQVIVTPGPVSKIDLTPADTSITAGEMMTFRIEVQDANGNRAQLPEDREFWLGSAPAALAVEMMRSPEEQTGEFFLPSDPTTPVTRLTMLEDSATALLLYRNTDANDGDPHSVIVQSDDGLTPGLSDRAEVTVRPAAIDSSVSSVVAVSPVVAVNDTSTVTVTVLDEYSNPISGEDVKVTVTGDARLSDSTGTTNDNGWTTFTVTDAVAETVYVDATAGEIVLGESAEIVFIPGAPYETITATVYPETITANGISTSLVTSDPLTDEFGNIVTPGTLVEVTTDRGTIISEDLDPGTPEIERATDASGIFTCVVQSSATPGTATITMTSRTGSAEGSVTVEFAPRPEVTPSGAPIPGTVGLGDMVAFEVQVQNASPTACTLSVNTTFAFTDGEDSFSAALRADTYIGVGSPVTLVFDSTVVPPSMDPGRYQPLLALQGTDQFGAPFDTTFQLPSILVSAVDLAYVPNSLRPDIVSAGRVHSIGVELQNNGTASVTLEKPGTQLEFTDGPHVYTASLQTNTAIAHGGGPVWVAFDSVTVPEDFDTGTHYVTLYLDGNESGEPFADTLSAGDGVNLITVVSRAQVSYDSGSILPTLTTKGTTARFTVDVKNSGSAEVHLNPDSTHILFGGFEAALDGTSEIIVRGIGAEPTKLTFQERIVTADSGNYSPTLSLVGWENGLVYDTTLPVTDNVRVQMGADIKIVSISADPSVVTADTLREPIDVWMTVRNNGEAWVDLDSASIALEMGQPPEDHTGEFVVTGPTGFSELPGGGSQDSLLFVVSDNDSSGSHEMTPGIFAIEGELAVTPRGGGNPITVDTYHGGTGYLTVQSPGTLEILDVTASRDTVTVGQTGWFVDVDIANKGGSKLDIDFENCSLDFGEETSLWSFARPDTLLSGDTLLAEDGAGTIRFEIMGTDTVSGTYGIDATVVAEELNSGRILEVTSEPPVSGSITVQTAADVTLLVSTSRDTVTVDNQLPWTVFVDVTNEGESAVTVDFHPDSTVLEFPNEVTAFGIDHPEAFVGGGDVVYGGQKRVMEFVVDTTRSVEPMGNTPIEVTVRWKEINTERSVTAQSSDTVLVQLEPAPSYVEGSLVPTAVTMGKTAYFKLDVSEIDGTSKLVLDRDRTRLTFDFGGGNVRETALAVSSPNVIAAGADTTLEFQGLFIDTLFESESVVPTLRIVGTENGNPFVLDSIPTDAVGIKKPTTVTIDVLADRTTVTKGQTEPWTISMVAYNHGNSNVVLDSTRLSFTIRGDEEDKTSGYTVVPLHDGNFLGSTTKILPAGPSSSDELQFQVDETDTTAGLLTIYGTFWGTDIEADTTVTDEAFFDGVTVQEPGSLYVMDIRPRSPTVTAGQSAPCTVAVDIRNVGEATVNLTFDETTPFVRTDPDGAFVWEFPDSLGSGALSLLGGSGGGPPDRLLFVADSTVGPVGDVTLHFVIEGKDANSKETVLINTDSAAVDPGIIKIQNPPKLVILRTEAITPVVDTVNVGQTFPVEVEIKNHAAAPTAGAVDVRVVLTSTGESVITPDTLTIESIAANTSVVDTFTVTAAEPVGSETLTANIIDARDANAGEELFVNGPHSDSLVVIQKSDSSSLVIQSVTPVPSEVTRGQTTPWWVDVAVKNDGGAPLDVAVPSDSDISFWIGERELIGYVVDAPETFLEAPTLRLEPQQVGTLQYTILATGNRDVGEVTIHATESWVDVYDENKWSTEDSATVSVVNPSGLFINSTYVDFTSAPNQPQENLVLVNSGQTVTVRVNVANFGDVEDVDSVQVHLENRVASLPPNLDSGYYSIPGGADTTIEFPIVELEPLETGEESRVDSLFASIVHAVSASTGKDVISVRPRDAEETIIVQKRADLSVSMWVSDPLGDSTFSTGQTFTLAARVDNNGVAEVEGPGKLELTLPGEFSLDPDTQLLTVDFTVGEAVSWYVRAETVASDRTLQVEITGEPNDKNTGDPAHVDENGRIATFVVNVVEAAAFSNPDIAITDPGGAMDNTLSTGQDFEITGWVDAESTTVDITATLETVSGSGFTIIDLLEQFLGEGGDSLVATWRITAPDSPESGQFRVLFDGRDENSNDPKSISTDILDVEVVPAAEITLYAEIWDPPDVDVIVPIGAKFGVRAWVENTPGHAGIDTDLKTPELEIDFSGAEEYVLAPGSGPGVQDFDSVAHIVYWTVQAPPAVTPARTIVVEVHTAPLDENSGEQAVLLNGGREFISIQTDTAFVTIDNLSTDLHLDENKVVPADSKSSDIRLLAVEIANPGADAARVDEIGVTLKDGDGNAVGAPSKTIAGIYASRASGSDRVPGDIGQNPMVFNLNSLPDSLVIAGAEADSLVFAVSISDKAATGEIRLCIEEAGDIVITNTVSGKRIAAVDKSTLGSVAGKLCSQLLVIMSGQFEEYAHNYPNPFRAGSESTRIAYKLDSGGDVSVRIYSLTGDLVWEPSCVHVRPETSAGPHEIEWDGRNCSGQVVRNGIYVCEIKASGMSTRFNIAVAK
jgi:hypothetical protein